MLPRALAAAAALSLLLPAPAEARRRRSARAAAEVVLDGVPTRVHWTDGDSFRIDDGPLRGFGARLVGVNALETFGPVHRFGRQSPQVLYEIAKGSAALAASGRWTCAMGGSDAYHRLLVTCPAAAALLVRKGHAMVFALGAEPDSTLVALQREAQADRVGMWAGGVPREILTSVHSADERGLGARGAYDRVADTRTGVGIARSHARTYATCQEVCAGEGEDRSCMVYVPFERRYRARPACLR